MSRVKLEGMTVLSAECVSVQRAKQMHAANCALCIAAAIQLQQENALEVIKM